MDKKTAIKFTVGLTIVVTSNVLAHLAVHRAGKRFDERVASMNRINSDSIKPIVQHD